VCSRSGRWLLLLPLLMLMMLMEIVTADIETDPPPRKHHITSHITS